MPYQNILFDLDGTLTDPKIGITKSVQYALAKFDIEVSDLDVLEPFIGPPLEDSFKDLYQFSKTDAKIAVAYYREYFSPTGIFENKVYPGIEALLKQLKASGKKIIVATSKPTVFAEKILKHFELEGYIDAVCGSNLDGSMVEKAEIISYVLANHVTPGETVVMIGDRKFDILGAQNNGVDTIAVGYGYGSEEELVGCKPTHYVSTVEALGVLLNVIIG